MIVRSIDRFPALTALIQKLDSALGEQRVYHPEAPQAVQQSIDSLKRTCNVLLGYEPPVFLHKLSDRWLADVSRGGTAVGISELRVLVRTVDRELVAREPHLACEYRIEGTRYPELVQDKFWGRTNIFLAAPSAELRDVVFTVENATRQRFGIEPFISVYKDPPDHLKIYVSLQSPDQNRALEGRLRSLCELLKTEHSLLDFEVRVDGRAISDGRHLLRAAPERDFELSQTEFNRSLRTL